MEAITITTKGGQVVPAFRFNGKIYRKHEGAKYYTCHTWKLHRDVWEHYKGAIPKGYQIHHKDFNPDNNEIENLVCLSAKEHRALHIEYDRQNGGNERRKANCDRIRPLASKWHGSEEGRKWHSEHARKQERKEQDFVCTVCGASYKSKNPASKYCSDKCSAKARRDSGIDNETRICPICGKPFETNKYGKQRFCSLSCGAKHRRSIKEARKGV